MNKEGVCILGIFAVDTSYHAKRMPEIAETIMGSNFVLGPGGKGSNQAVAASKAGASVTFISKIGQDAFGELAIRTLEDAGVTPRLEVTPDLPTGAAFIFVNETTGENAIIVVLGAAGTISIADVEKQRACIEGALVFVTQLEQAIEAALHALKIASAAGVITVFNPAPAKLFSDEIYALCDYIAPNEVEAAEIVGFEIATDDDARRAADILLGKGARAVLMTLGARGVLFQTAKQSERIPAQAFGKVIDTTGAGDAFLGGFASALSQGYEPLSAVKFGCVTAGIAVTRRGTALAMPSKDEIEKTLAKINQLS